MNIGGTLCIVLTAQQHYAVICARDYSQCIIIKGAIVRCDIIKRTNASLHEHNAIIYEVGDSLIRIRAWLLCPGSGSQPNAIYCIRTVYFRARS